MREGLVCLLPVLPAVSRGSSGLCTMSMRTLPLVFINLGGEMLYILDQRLQAHNTSEDNSEKGKRQHRYRGVCVCVCGPPNHRITRPSSSLLSWETVTQACGQKMTEEEVSVPYISSS